MTRASAPPPPGPADAPRPPFATPEAAQEAYYAAFSATDVAAMAAVWGEDAICIHPGGGLLKGKQAVMQSWMEIFAGAHPPSIEVEAVAARDCGDLAIRVLVESIRPNGQPAEAASQVLATNVFLLVDGSWCLVQHHASLPLRVAPSANTASHRVH